MSFTFWSVRASSVLIVRISSNTKFAAATTPLMESPTVYRFRGQARRQLEALRSDELGPKADFVAPSLYQDPQCGRFRCYRERLAEFQSISGTFMFSGEFDLRRFNANTLPICLISRIPTLRKPELQTHWRREWDSNPRYPCEVYTLSKRAPSATRPSLRSTVSESTATSPTFFILWCIFHGRKSAIQ